MPLLSPAGPARVGLLAFAVALAVVPPASGSARAFAGKPCSLFTAKQVAAIVGDSATGTYACAPSKTFKTAAGTTYSARAGAGTATAGGFFSIQVVKYSSGSTEGRVKQQYKALLKKPLTGVGDWAYAKIGMSAVLGGTADTGQLAFGAKGYGVLVDVRAKLKKTVDQQKLKALAKQIAGEL